MEKTDSIKDRRIDVYCDTLQHKDRWATLADEADESLSTWVRQW